MAHDPQRKATVRVRIAPSPTGFAHIATARTALINYLFAKQHRGSFVLRIEDTDRSRSTVEYERDILDQLTWLGLPWDEGPYRQTERLALYRQRAAELLKKGLAYRKDGALYFKVDVRGPDITVRDLIKGEVVFPRRELADFVLLRADETPVYNFAVVVDDIDMGVTHVIRGEDHLSNTPKHMLLFEAFGVKPPAFAHLPIILGPDGSKLSKRHGAVSVREYRRRGYLPEAILNFVILLGWSPVRGKTSAGPTGQEEIISLNEMVERFRLEEVSRHPAIFDTNKLDFFNGWYLRHLPLGELADRLLAWYRYVGKKPPAADEYLLSVLATLQERLKRLEEFPQLSSFYFAEPSYEADLLVFAKSDPDRTRKGLVESLESLASLTRWSRDDIQAALEAVVKSNKLGNGDVFWPVRVAVTGLPASPPPVDVLVVLGKERSLARLRRALRLLSRQKSG